MRKSVHTPEYRLFLRLLREVRKSSGISQEELAEAIGETQSWVSKLERGERRIDVIETHTICAALGFGFSRLMTRLDREIASL